MEIKIGVARVEMTQFVESEETRTEINTNVKIFQRHTLKSVLRTFNVTQTRTDREG